MLRFLPGLYDFVVNSLTDVSQPVIDKYVSLMIVIVYHTTFQVQSLVILYSLTYEKASCTSISKYKWVKK